MNARIKELAGQAGYKHPDAVGECEDYAYFDHEKFAELIVRECCEVLEQTQDVLDRQKWPTPRGCTEYIKEHFGVTE